MNARAYQPLKNDRITRDNSILNLLAELSGTRTSSLKLLCRNPLPYHFCQMQKFLHQKKKKQKEKHSYIRQTWQQVQKREVKEGHTKNRRPNNISTEGEKCIIHAIMITTPASFPDSEQESLYL